MNKGWMVIPVLTILINCAPRRTVEKTETSTPVPRDTLVEPTPPSSNQEPVIIFEDEVPAINEQQSEQPEVSATKGLFRVQVFATVDKSKAEAIMDAIKEKENIPVFIEQEEGLYKVRVGEFKTRVEAEGFRNYIRTRGYPDAFVVEMKH